MIAKLLGVANDPADYSCGFDLLAENAPKRRYSLQANWDEVFFTGLQYKTLIPLDAISYAKQVITDENDNPLPSMEPFYAEHNADFVQVQKDLTRFSVPGNVQHSGNRLAVIFAAVVGIILLAIAAVRLFRRRSVAE